MTLINISPSKKIIVSIIAVILIFLGYYLGVYKSFTYQSNNEIIGNVLMIISISLFPMLWYDVGEDSSSKGKIFVIPIVIISFFVQYLITTKRKEYSNKELSKNIVNVKGLVIGFENDKTRYSSFNYVRISYEFENKQIIQRIEDFDNEYKLNQNLSIIISKRNPEIFEILDAEK